MSRKNRKYGNSWLEEHFDLFCRHTWYSVKAWTHMACGPWWAPQSDKRIGVYEIARFRTIAEYKAWSRERMKNVWNTPGGAVDSNAQMGSREIRF